MENFELIHLSNRCLDYLAVLGRGKDTMQLFRESFDGDPTVEAVHEFLLDLEEEHARGTDWLVGHWLMDMTDLNDIWKLPLSRNEVLYLMLRIECACDLLPSLCRSDPQVHPNQRFFLSISSATEREAVLWALTSFWNHIRLFYFHIAAERMHSNLLHTP